MATVNVASSQNLTAVTYLQGDIINVGDGVTLTINSQWSIKPYLIQALGTGRIEVSNSSNTTPHLQEFYMQNALNSGGFSTTQNGVLQVRGDWITVGTSTGANNQTLFSANNIGGVAIDYPTHIEVETGSGTNVWEVWQAVPLDVTGGLVNTNGFNGQNATAGTVAVSAAGVVTGTGTAFSSVMTGVPFKLPGITRDFVIGVFTSATQITIQELDGSTYTGGVIAAGSSYIIRSGSLISASVVGSGDLGKMLFFNPVTTAVSHGDGTNGTKVPTGARLRVPNIHFNAAIQQTTLAAAITSSAAQAITLTAAIGSASNDASATAPVGTLLLVNGSTIERISYSTRTGTTVSATGMFRGVGGTTAQASFPIGTTVYWIPATGTNATRNGSVFNTNVSGTVDLQICSAGLRMQALFNNFASATIKNFGCAFFSITNSSGSYDLDTISALGQYQFQFGGIGANFGSLIGTGSIRNIHTHGNFALASSGTAMSFINIQDAQAISNLRCRLFNRTPSVSVNFRSILLQTVTCATPIDGLYFNMVFQATTLTNQDIKNIYFSSTTSSASAGTGDGAFPVYVQSTVNTTFRGIQLWSGGLCTRNFITIDSNSADCVFHNKGYPAIDGGLQLGSIISDVGLNTITAFFSITNPRTSTTTGSYLRQDITTNSSGLFRMLLIDSITATTSGSGGQAKGGVEIDMIAGPHRLFATGTATSIIPNLVDVQPIVVLTNLAKTTGSVYLGSFSAQNAFDMYTFTGGTYLDNLGRIYYPAIGDAVVIKSAFALKGFSDFTGTAFDFNYNLGGGNPIPAGTTVEFRMTNWGAANTGAWTAFTNNASLETARAALTDYSPSVGLDLQIRITGTTAVAGRYLMSMKLPVTIDASYSPPVSETAVGVVGAQPGTLIAGYLNSVPSAPVFQSALLLTGSAGSVDMSYDYDATPVPYRLVARKAGYTFSSLTGTYLKTAVSIPLTQLEVVDTSGTPLYASGVTGVAVDHGASTITLSASRTAAQVWSATQDNLCLLANVIKADPFSTSNGSAYYSVYTLAITGTLTAGNIVGNVTLAGSLSSGVSITGNVSQATPTDLTGVIITGDLTYTTNTPITVTLTGCTITGTISNSGTGLVTVRLAGGSTVGTVGSNVVTQIVTSLTLTALAAGSSIYVADASSVQVDYVASSGTSYTLDTTGGTGTWTYKVARYGYTAQTGTLAPATTSTAAAITLVADPFITQPTVAAVAAYIQLGNPDKIYDYAAYYETTNAGIPIARIASKAGSYCSVGSYLYEMKAVGLPWILSGTSLVFNTGYAFAPGTTMTAGLLTTSTATLTAQATSSGKYGIVAGNTVVVSGTNYQDIISTSGIIGLPTSGSISTSGTLAFGSNTSIVATGSLSASNTALSGILNLSGAPNFTLIDCTSSNLVVNSTTNCTVRCLGTTLATAVTAGTNVTIIKVAPIIAPNLLADTTVVLCNAITREVLDEQILNSTGYIFNAIWTSDITVELRHAKIGYIPKISTGILSSTGVSFLDTQVVDQVYNIININGSSVTEFTADYPNIQIDLADSDGKTTFQRLYTWFRYIETTYSGLSYFVDGLTATDEYNFAIDVSTINLTIKNVLSAPVFITGGNMTRSDGTTIIAANSGSIQIQPDKAYVANSAGISSSLAAIEADVPAIKINTNLIPALL